MYVRGGGADQNLVLLDDVPVYNPYHMYGLFGIFNGDIIKNAQDPVVVEARFGNRAGGGVLDVITDARRFGICS